MTVETIPAIAFNENAVRPHQSKGNPFSNALHIVLTMFRPIHFGLMATAMVLIALAIIPAVGFRIQGNYHAVVMSGSMTGAVNTGEVVVYEPYDGVTPLPVGTIVEYQHGPITVTHRIISVNDDGTYTTKGDANMAADRPITADQIKGVAVELIRGEDAVPIAGLNLGTPEYVTPALWNYRLALLLTGPFLFFSPYSGRRKNDLFV